MLHWTLHLEDKYRELLLFIPTTKMYNFFTLELKRYLSLMRYQLLLALMYDIL